MPVPGDAGFWWRRIGRWWQRGQASLRTRGMAASARLLWQRLRPSTLPPRLSLYAPPASAFAPFALPTATAPRASIVIPVHGALAHTLACLRALAAHPPATPFEVIVVDDGSPDASLQTLQHIAGLRLHARARNGGFIAACNDGAALARGDHLVFLNNDTVPQPGWLDALLATFDQHPGTGLAGARLVYPDGRLQEAGGVVFADGSGWNYGRFDDPAHCRYAYLRDADYLSGAAIAIPAALFRQLGGFDARYAPAYYEDTDLAFKVRAAGHRVLYQPASVVVHAEGVTAGTDIGSGPKAAQVRNRAIFAEAWAEPLRRIGGTLMKEKRTRNIAMLFRVTAREQELIIQKMEQLGIRNQEAYLRKMAIDGYSVRLDLPEIRELIVQLRKYGTNLNQLAKSANQGGNIYAKDVEMLRANHEQLFTLASEMLKRLAAL